MKADRLPDEYFDKLSSDPVILKPFDPESKAAAKVYGKRLETLLAQFPLQAELFGSTDLEIDSKGEWEFGIWLDNTQWYPVLIVLINHFGSIHTLSDDFALFNDVSDDHDIEIITMRGEAAVRNQAIMNYWRNNPEAVMAYRAGKIAHAHSQQEYFRWKNKHISDIVETL